MDLESLQNNGLIVTELFQALFPNLGPMMVLVSQIGSTPAYFAVIFLIYWSTHKSHGKKLAILLLAGGLAALFFKQLFQQPRPFWLNPDLQLSDASGYGFPSGHVTSATIFAFYIAYRLKRRNIWLLAIIYTLLMGLSRIYLGVHFWYDTVGGLLLGGLVLSAGLIWWHFYEKPFGERILGQRFWFSQTGILTGILLYGGILYLLFFFDLREISPFDLNEIPNRSTLEGVTILFSLLIGMSAGFEIEKSWVCFECAGTFWQKSYRYLIGLLVVLLIYFGLRAGLAGGRAESANSVAPWLPFLFDAVLYVTAGFCATYLVPWLFVLLRLDRSLRPSRPIISLNPDRFRQKD